jgi:parallel beta-helix repeat protein
MSKESLQDRLDGLREGDTLTLEPPLREFKGPLVIRKAAVIEGQGGTIWTVTGPTVKIEAPGVVLRNLAVEITSRDAALSGEGACALEIQPGLAVDLENVAVRGNVAGLAQEEGAWMFPRHLALGTVQATTPHEFRVKLVVPVPCTLTSAIDGLDVQPQNLPAGPAEVLLRLDALPASTRLRGQLLLRTRLLVRRIEVTGQYADGGVAGTGQFLWRPAGEAEPDLEVPDLSLDLIESEAPRSGPVSPPTITAPTPPTTPTSPALAGVLVVSAFDTGQYRTITEALQRAGTGVRVLVRPGVYKESLKIMKKVEIVGDGPDGEVVLECEDGNCVLMAADMARIRGLTLRGAAARSGRERYAVHVPRGQLILEDCQVSSDSLACLASTAAGAMLLLRRCQVKGGASAGVLAVDRGEAVLEDCEVAEHALAGVEARRGGNVTLRHSRLSACGQAGVLVHDQGKATLEGCDVFSNTQAGVEVRDGAEATLRRCKIRHNQGPGVRVHADGKAALEECDLSENVLANLEVRHGGNPTLRRCKLRQGKQAGALFGRDAQGTLEDCQLEGNVNAAVEIKEGANPTLRRCTTRQCGLVAVAVRDNARGLFEECDLAEAGLAVVELRQGVAPILRRCKVHDGARAGVLAAARAAARLEDCEVFANQGPGVAVTGGGNPTLQRCRIRENGQAGVVVWDNGRGVLEQCEITENGLSGLAIGPGGAPTARSCRLVRNRDAGLWARHGAAGEVVRCDLTGNGTGSIEQESGARVHLDGNRADS